MQTMELVDIGDVYPYEENDVRMNPRDCDSKECREYIAQLAEQFRFNKLNPGQPRVRPILYRDGGIYKIIDGECRYRAMLGLGTKKFYADVYDDLADAETARQEAAKAMVETDAKRALTPEEMSRGVQAMLALDIPDEEVAAVARIDAGKVRRAKRGAKAVSDAAYDMSIDRLAAIAEFDGDPDAVAKLRDCSQREWHRIYESLVADRRRKTETARMVEEAKSAGVRVAESTPDGFIADRTFGPADGSALDRFLEGGGADGSIAVVGDFGLTLLKEVGGGKVTKEQQESEQEKSDFYAAFDDAARARAEWVGERVADITRMRKTARFLNGKAHGSKDVQDFQRTSGATVVVSVSPLSVAVGFQSLSIATAFSVWHAILHGDASYLYPEAARDTLGLLEAMSADGYELSEAEEKTAAACRAEIEGESNER